MIRSFLTIVALVGGYYAKEEGLPKPELVGERTIAERNLVASTCAQAFGESLYAIQTPAQPTADTAAINANGRGFSVRWNAGSIAAAPNLAIDCYAVGTSVVHLEVNGDTIVANAQ